MQINERTDAVLHQKLPIDADEKVLAVYRHHWFAYAVNWIVGFMIVLVIMALAIAVIAVSGSDSSIGQYKLAIIGGAALFSILVLSSSSIPVYLRSQEQLVLTDESLFQVLRPSIFASKIDQLNLQRIDDVSVRQDFLGTVMGYGHLTIETPGEQDNYEFFMLPDSHDAAREISNARENYEAAMQSGRLPTTLGGSQAAPANIDPQKYQEFLEYEKWQAQQAQQSSGQQPATPPPASGEAPQAAQGAPRPDQSS